MTEHKNGDTVRGKCRCHGVIIEGTLGTVAQPKAYYLTDMFTQERMRCVAVLVNGGVHDVAVGDVQDVPVEEVQ